MFFHFWCWIMNKINIANKSLLFPGIFHFMFVVISCVSQFPQNLCACTIRFFMHVHVEYIVICCLSSALEIIYRLKSPVPQTLGTNVHCIDSNLYLFQYWQARCQVETKWCPPPLWIVDNIAAKPYHLYTVYSSTGGDDKRRILPNFLLTLCFNCFVLGLGGGGGGGGGREGLKLKSK